MASNPLPANPGALIVLAGKCENGLAQYAAILNITQTPPPDSGQTPPRSARP